MSVQNMRDEFPILAVMKTYFSEQDQALANRRAEMKTTWSRKNQEFQDQMTRLHDFYNLGDL